MKRIVSLFLSAVIFLSLATITGCTTETANNVSSKITATKNFYPTNKKVKVWGDFGTDYWESFKRDYPDIEIDHGTSSDNSLATLAAAISAGNQPDLYFTNSASNAPLGQAFYKKLITPLDNYILNDKDYNLSQLPTWYNKFVTYDTHVYAVYTDVSVPCLIWNKDLFKKANLDPEKPPKTQSEMLDMAKKLTKFDSNGMVTQAGYTDKWWFQAWRLTYGTPYQDEKGKITINTAETKNMLEFLLKFPVIYGGWDKVPATVNWDAGNVAMGVGDVGYNQKMANANFEIGMSPLPSPDGYTGTQIVSGYTWQWYGIPTGAKNPDGGWLFAKWAVTKGVSGVMDRAAKTNPETFVPVYMAEPKAKKAVFDKYLGNVRADIKLSINDREKIYNKINMIQPVNAPDNAKWESVMQDKMVSIIGGEVSVNDGLTDLQRLGDQFYNEFLTDAGLKK
jgi:ABC-type glycerol-3-phosphate transport system substrate-binding protein